MSRSQVCSSEAFQMFPNRSWGPAEFMGGEFASEKSKVERLSVVVTPSSTACL